MQLNAFKQQLINYIVHVNLDGFFTSAYQWVRSDVQIRQELHQRQAAWNLLKKQQIGSILSDSEYRLEFNRITDALLRLTSLLGASDLKVPLSTPPPRSEFLYELNRVDRARELWELNDFCHGHQEALQRFVVLVADIDTDAEAFVDLWLLDQAKLGLRSYIYDPDDKENGHARGIQVWNWAWTRHDLEKRIQDGLKRVSLQEGNAHFVAFIRIPGDFLSMPAPQLLADLAAIAKTCSSEPYKICPVVIFLHLEEVPTGSGWQQGWKACLNHMKVLSEWSSVTRRDVKYWLAGKGLAPWEEDEYLNQWFPYGQESISMNYFRRHARKFLVPYYSYES